MIEIKLAVAARKRLKGSKMMVGERNAYAMMEKGLAEKDIDFMAEWERKLYGKPKRGRPKKRVRAIANISKNGG